MNFLKWFNYYYYREYLLNKYYRFNTVDDDYIERELDEEDELIILIRYLVRKNF